MPTDPSRYAPLWEDLKATGEVRLEAESKFHSTITKAVRKRRNLDLGFKFMLAEEHKVVRLRRKSVGNVLTLTLRYNVEVTAI